MFSSIFAITGYVSYVQMNKYFPFQVHRTNCSVELKCVVCWKYGGIMNVPPNDGKMLQLNFGWKGCVMFCNTNWRGCVSNL